MQIKSNFTATDRQIDPMESSSLSASYGSPEVVGVFLTEAELESAIDELLLTGFDRQQISVLASKQDGPARGNTFAKLLSVREMEDDPQTRLSAFVSSDSRAEIEATAIGVPIYAAAVGGYAAVVASGGALALALAALLLVGAAGGALGGFLAHTISQRHRDAIAAQLAGGGLLIWVQAHRTGQVKEAIGLLNAHHGRHVHVHHIKRAWGIGDVPFNDAQPDPFLTNRPKSKITH